MKPPPIPEWELWGCALEMVRQHGADAGTRSAMRADEMMERGDIAGARTWRLIMARADMLLKGEGTLQ